MKLVADKTALVGTFSEGLGRAAYVYGALEYDRPFLAPLYSFVSRYSPDAVRPLPLYVSVTLQHLADRLQLRRIYTCAATHAPESAAWRVDAQASDGSVGVGGWWPVEDASGEIQPRPSPWFHVKLTPENAPWAFTKGAGQTCRLIAALEALAALIALVVFGSKLTPQQKRPTLIMPMYTDNQSNGFAVNRLLTTCFPLCAIVMEMTVQKEDLNVRLDVNWTTTRKRTGFRMGTVRGSAWTNKRISISQVSLGQFWESCSKLERSSRRIWPRRRGT